MKLSVSNIAWDPEEDAEVLALLAKRGVAGVEVAPSKLWPDWRGATPAAAREAARRFADQGFAVPALQAILFGRPELKVFGDDAGQAALLDHLERVAELAAGLGAKALVFGSPKNRDPGDLPPEEAFKRGVEVFRRIGERFAPHGVNLCLEPNPGVYACRFMTSYRDVQRMVAEVGHESVCIHLDVACIELEGDDPVEAVQGCAGGIAHFHATEPNLGDFDAPRMRHAEVGRALREADYDGWVSIEMRRPEDPIASIEQAVSFVQERYGDA